MLCKKMLDYFWQELDYVAAEIFICYYTPFPHANPTFQLVGSPIHESQLEQGLESNLIV